LRCSNKKTRQDQPKPSPTYGKCGVIRKKLLSQNALVNFAVCGFELPAWGTNFLSPLSIPSNDLGEKISNIAGAREHLSFWHGMASKTWKPCGFQTNASINFGL
jgi:hypothetical protein